ncbi:hypothetical protein REPUB_Repub09cG0093800 [Reevesia pubescens]
MLKFRWLVSCVAALWSLCPGSACLSKPSAVQRLNTFQIAPPVDCLKLNVDGSIQNARGCAGFGGVMRNNVGSVVGLFSSPASIVDVNTIELLTIKANGLADSLDKAGVSRLCLFEAR